MINNCPICGLPYHATKDKGEILFCSTCGANWRFGDNTILSGRTDLLTKIIEEKEYGRYVK